MYSGWLSWSRCQVAHSEDSALSGMVELLPLRFAGGDVHEVLRHSGGRNPGHYSHSEFPAHLMFALNHRYKIDSGETCGWKKDEKREHL